MRRVLFIALALAAAPSPPAGAEGVNALHGLRLEDLVATRDRPLFSPSRRPPPPRRVEAPPPPPPAPEPAVQQAAAPEAPPFDLIGSAVGEANSFVLLRKHGTNEVTRLRPGDEKDGWRVGMVSLRSVVLERGDRSESLALSAPDKAAATPLPQLAGPAPPPAEGEQLPVDAAAAADPPKQVPFRPRMIRRWERQR